VKEIQGARIGKGGYTGDSSSDLERGKEDDFSER